MHVNLFESVSKTSFGFVGTASAQNRCVDIETKDWYSLVQPREQRSGSGRKATCTFRCLEARSSLWYGKRR
jgi:hypothetical protein